MIFLRHVSWSIRMSISQKKPGRPRTEAVPLTNSERSRRRRERLRAQGAKSQTITLTPEMMRGLEEWAALIDQQKTVEEMVEVTLGISLVHLMEPGKKELMEAFVDPQNKPAGRILALLGAVGLQAMQNQINRELGVRR